MKARIAFVLAAVVAVAVRLHNAFSYPPDWGFDASHNWQYIYALTKTWQLPAVDAAWSTGDPPLYFYLCAAVLRIVGPKLVWIPLLSVALGLAIVAAAMHLTRRTAPGDPQRALLAGGLLLFLPAHIHMSAMVNETMLAALCSSLALMIFVIRASEESVFAPRLRRVCATGGFGGLAMLAKPSGVLVVLATVASSAWAGWRQRDFRATGLRILALIGIPLALAGWFYARSANSHGTPLPSGLPAHELMLSMPPGERGALDYLRIPLATFTDPQLLNPDLLQSVWGSTYAAIWFDAHRYFLPTDSDAVRHLGTLTLLLALLPTCAFVLGLGRGVRRCLRGEYERDAPLVLLVLMSFAGYAAFAWVNPWFAVLKGTSLLGLSLPYAYYASDSLLRWARGGRAAALGIGTALATLALCVTISCTFAGLFERNEVSGLKWKTVEQE